MWTERPKWVLIKEKYLNKNGFEWIAGEKIELFFVNEIENSWGLWYIRINYISGIRNYKIVAIKIVINLQQLTWSTYYFLN